MKRPITIISIISILLFIAALSWFGIGIYQDGKSGSEHNERVFDTLVFKTVNAANQYKIGTPDFSKKFIEAIGKIENYSSLRLEANGNLIYSYPPAGFSLPSPSLTNTFRKTQIANGGISLTISASMYSIQTNSVYHYAQFAFVLILLGTSISLILLVILRDKKENTDSKTKDDSDNNFEDEMNIDYGDENNIFDDDAEDAEILDEPAEKTEDEENPFDKLDFGSESDEEQLNQEKSVDSELDDSVSNSLSENQEKNQNFESDNGDKTDEHNTGYIEENAPKTDSTQENSETEEAKSEDFDKTAEEELPFATDISDGDFDIQDDNFFSDSKNEKNGEDFSENLNNIPYSESEKTRENDEKTLEETSATNTETNSENETNTNSVAESENFKSSPVNENKNSDFLSNFDFDENADISPATGLKMQSSLSENLGEKITQSLDEKKELTLALLKINNLDRGNAISNKLVEILKNDLSKTAEIFEYNSDGYAIILYNEDLSSCAETFDKIYENMTSYLRENNSANEVVIGLSSVSGRNVDSPRLETEAAQALSHALEDPDSPIIAFRANPQKYKEYIESKKD